MLVGYGMKQILVSKNRSSLKFDTFYTIKNQTIHYSLSINWKQTSRPFLFAGWEGGLISLYTLKSVLLCRKVIFVWGHTAFGNPLNEALPITFTLDEWKLKCWKMSKSIVLPSFVFIYGLGMFQYHSIFWVVSMPVIIWLYLLLRWEFSDIFSTLMLLK